jgi:rhodanese-related sulfurtransferase
MSECTIEELAVARADGATVIDVREAAEYVDGHVPGAVFVPMSRLPSHTHELDKSRPVYLICASGNRSRAMADFLERSGFDARSVSGGTTAWVSSGHPVVTGRHAS